MGSLPPNAARDLTAEEIAAQYPSDLTLRYVHIFFRHGTIGLMNKSNGRLGERTPVRQRLAVAGIPPFWNVCKAADEFRGAALLPSGEFRSLHYRRKLEIPESNGRLGNVNRNGERYWYYSQRTKLS